jgi:hypothetical protein
MIVTIGITNVNNKMNHNIFTTDDSALVMLRFDHCTSANNPVKRQMLPATTHVSGHVSPDILGSSSGFVEFSGWSPKLTRAGLAKSVIFQRRRPIFCQHGGGCAPSSFSMLNPPSTFSTHVDSGICALGTVQSCKAEMFPPDTRE